MGTQLVQMAAAADLFHDDKHDGFATIQIGDHRETWPLRSAGFKRWLLGRFFTITGKTAKASTFSDALTVIDSKAQFEGDLRRVWVRTAQGDDGCIYLDLGDASWRAVRVAPNGWTVVDVPPVHFIRGSTSVALPLPARGGSVDSLRQVINLPDDDDFKRVVGWLLGALRPWGPYPVLAFIAEQGSGKSAAARLLRSLIDPSSIPLRGSIRDERDLVIAARTTQVVAFDNVAHLPQWLSDALCRVATGGGFSTRRLYTDAEEEIFTQTRPLLITGIDDYISNGDLLDRTMIVTLPTIAPTERRQEKDLEATFNHLHPLVLGALLDATCAALRNVDAVKFAMLPRMADFAAWVAGAEEELGWTPGSFLDAYCSSATEAQDIVLEASPIGEPLRELVDSSGFWEGTAAGLLSTLSERVDEAVRRSKAWPKTGRGITGPLRRLAPTLRALGIEVSFTRSATRARKRTITLRRIVPDPTVHTVQTVHPAEAEHQRVDGADDMDGEIATQNPTMADASWVSRRLLCPPTNTKTSSKKWRSGCERAGFSGQSRGAGGVNSS